MLQGVAEKVQHMYLT